MLRPNRNLVHAPAEPRANQAPPGSAPPSASPSSNTPRRALPWRTVPRLLAVVVGLALLEFVLTFAFARRAPQPEDWARARGAVESWYHPGDLVAVAPYWAEPMARWKFGSTLMPLRDVARPDVSRYAHAIEVSTMGSRDPELAGWAQEAATKVGPLTIRKLRQPSPPNVRYVFTDHVEPPAAEAFIDSAGHAAECPYTTSALVQTGGLSGNPTFPAARFACGAARGGDRFAGITIIDDEQFRPRRCIWMFAPGGQQEMGVRFVQVPLGEVIQGYTGAHWMFEREATSSFVVRVLVDGDEIGRVLHQDGSGWSPFRLVLKSNHAGRTSNVEFRAAAPGGHPVCLEADTR